MNDNKILRKNSNMVSRVIDKETILVPIYKTSDEINAIYSLNEVASKVWDLIDGKRTLGEIKTAVLKTFDTNPKEVEKKMAEFLKDLYKIKAISLI